jgi:hypothetical protein
VLANTTSRAQGSKKLRDYRLGLGGFSGYLGSFHQIPERLCALQFKLEFTPDKAEVRRCLEFSL